MAQSLRKFFMVFALSLMFLTCFMFGACSNGGFKDNPAPSDVVVGNGSLAVMKGNYLYFVNGYQSYSDVGKNNQEGKVTYSALYRIKLDANKNPEKANEQYDDQGNEIPDKTRALKNVDILASKVVGFEYMGLYIFGDYIYYTSPNDGVDKNLEPTTQYIDFFRRKIDGTGSAERIYTSKAEGSKVSFSMLEFDGDVYLNILDDQKLVIIKNVKIRKEIENVSSALFINYSSSNETVTDFNKDVYFTRDLDSNKDTQLNGNVLCKFNLKTMTCSDVYKDDDSTFSLKQLGKTRLYYEKTIKSSGVSTAKLYAVAGAENNALIGEEEITSNTYSNYYLCPDQTTTILVYDGSNILKISKNNTETVHSSSATVIKAIDGYVYFTTSDNQIFRANYQTVGGDAETIVGEKAKVGQTNFVNVTNEKLFYLSTNQTNDSIYLHMVNLNDGEFTDYFVGVLEPKDYDE